MTDPHTHGLAYELFWVTILALGCGMVAGLVMLLTR